MVKYNFASCETFGDALKLTKDVKSRILSLPATSIFMLTINIVNGDDGGVIENTAVDVYSTYREASEHINGFEYTKNYGVDVSCIEKVGSPFNELQICHVKAKQWFEEGYASYAQPEFEKIDWLALARRWLDTSATVSVQ